jgi:hypothetical protein
VHTRLGARGFVACVLHAISAGEQTSVIQDDGDECLCDAGPERSGDLEHETDHNNVMKEGSAIISN